MNRWLVGAVAFLLAGCGGVVSEHPASDDASTRVDERLIGFWRIDRAASGEKDKGSKSENLIVVGKRPGPDGGLEWMFVTLEEGGVLNTGRDAIRATTIGGKPFVSVQMTSKDAEEQAEKGKGGWFVLRYDLLSDGSLRVFSMDVPTVAKDVQEKKIAGTVPATEPNAPADSVLITLSASTYALRAWLESRGEALFKTDKPLVLRRLDLH